MNLSRLLTLCAGATALVLLPALGPAQTIISAVPYTITTSGKYQLGANLVGSANQNLITINAPNVILDLNGFFLSGPSGSPSSGTSAIFVNNVSNVTIRNGTLANAGYGVTFSDNGGTGINNINHLVDGVNFTRCYLVGALLQGASPGSVLRNSTFSQIGGSTLIPNVNTGAIYVAGGVRVENNSIATVTAPGSGVAYGINAASTDFMIGNVISNCAVGISGGKYLNNLTSACITPFQGGVNATGNN